MILNNMGYLHQTCEMKWNYHAKVGVSTYLLIPVFYENKLKKFWKSMTQKWKSAVKFMMKPTYVRKLLVHNKL